MNEPKKIPPFCCDCRHFIPPPHDDKNMGLPNPPTDIARCGRAPMIDLVMGNQFFVPCYDFRSPDAPCGSQGNLFEKKI